MKPEPPLEIKCAAHVRQQAAKLKEIIEPPETEHNWEKMEAAIKRFTAATRNTCQDYPDAFVAEFKEPELIRLVIRCLTTERTRLSMTSLDLLSALTLVGPAFQPLLHLYAPVLIRLLGRTNKLYISRTQACLAALVQHTRLGGIIQYIEEGVHDKSASTRHGCIETLSQCFVHLDKAALERRLPQVEEMIRKGATDKEVKTREIAKKMWDTYKKTWPDRVDQFSAPLTPIIRRYLNIGGIARAAAASGRGSPTKLYQKPRMPSPLKTRPVKTAAKPPLASSTSSKLAPASTRAVASSQTRTLASSQTRTLKTSASDKAPFLASSTASSSRPAESNAVTARETANDPVPPNPPFWGANPVVKPLKPTPAAPQVQTERFNLNEPGLDVLFPPEATTSTLPSTFSVADLYASIQLPPIATQSAPAFPQLASAPLESNKPSAQAPARAPTPNLALAAAPVEQPKRTISQPRRAPGRAVIPAAAALDPFLDHVPAAPRDDPKPQAQRAVSSSRAFKPKRPANVLRSVSNPTVVKGLAFSNSFAPPKKDAPIPVVPPEFNGMSSTSSHPALSASTSSYKSTKPASKGPTTQSKIPQSPSKSRPASPVKGRPASPTKSRPASPVKTRPASPTKPRPVSPVKTRPVSPTKARPASPVKTRAASPIRTRPASPAKPRPASPSKVPRTRDQQTFDKPTAAMELKTKEAKERRRLKEQARKEDAPRVAPTVPAVEIKIQDLAPPTVQAQPEALIQVPATEEIVRAGAAFPSAPILDLLCADSPLFVASATSALEEEAKARSSPLSASILDLPPAADLETLVDLGVLAPAAAPLEAQQQRAKAAVEGDRGSVVEYELIQLDQDEEEAQEHTLMEDMYPNSLPSPCIKPDRDLLPSSSFAGSLSGNFTFATHADAFALPSARIGVDELLPPEPLVFPLGESEPDSFCMVAPDESNMTLTEKFDKLNTRASDVSLMRFDSPTPNMHAASSKHPVLLHKRAVLQARDSNIDVRAL